MKKQLHTCTPVLKSSIVSTNLLPDPWAETRVCSLSDPSFRGADLTVSSQEEGGRPSSKPRGTPAGSTKESIVAEGSDHTELIFRERGQK